MFRHDPATEISDESLEPFDDEPDATVTDIVPIDDEQIECATTFVDYVRQLKFSLDADLHIEQAVPIDHITGESEATGTSDAILVPRHIEELVVVDLKGGMYRIDAYELVQGLNDMLEPVTMKRPNLQLAMYASGALRKYGHRAKYIRMIIVQPRLNHISEWSGTVEELGETIRYLKQQAKAEPIYVPSFDTCHYCKGKPTCVKFTDEVLDTVFTDQTLTAIKPVPKHSLGELYRKCDLVELWAAEVRALAHAALVNHDVVPGLKLGQGRMGNRKWKDKERVEQLLTRDLGLPDQLTHTKKLVGPASIEGLSKGKRRVINDFQWTLLQEQITQNPGKPIVLLDEDPRPALPSPTAGFTDQSTAK